MKSKILVVYISTGLYNKMWNEFYNSISNFCPDSTKVIHRLTDEVYGNKVEQSLMTHIQHQPWPIVALMKFKYILHAMNLHEEERFDYVFYFNSNIYFKDNCPDNEFLCDRIVIPHNVGWDYLGHDPLKFTYGKEIDPKSKAHISGYYEYCQTCLFGGPWDMMKRFCTDCHEMTIYDLAHNRIPCFHDESYGNKWIYDNPLSVKIISNNWCMDEKNKDLYGYPNAHILMRDSSKTQYEYKDKFHE